MPRKEKLGGRGGVSQWKNLETSGDVRRLLAWTIHSLREGTLARADALAFGQLGAVMLKAVELSSMSDRMSAIEKALETPAADATEEPQIVSND
jgi:hypothetical protein